MTKQEKCTLILAVKGSGLSFISFAVAVLAADTILNMFEVFIGMQFCMLYLWYLLHFWLFPQDQRLKINNNYKYKGKEKRAPNSVPDFCKGCRHG